MQRQYRSLRTSATVPKPFSSLILGLGFSLTGTGTVMLGVLLPVLSSNWGLRDDASGSLFLLQFLGSTLGAVLTGVSRVRALRAGYALLSVGSLGLAFATRAAAFPIYFFFGLGLGLAMTATNLAISDRYQHDRAAKLERLNFAWSAGATSAPLLLIPFLRVAGLRTLFLTFFVLSLGFLAWMILFERVTPFAAQCGADAEPVHAPVFPGVLLPLIVLAMCSVGIEASLSGWLTTYSHRATSLGLSAAARTTALFLLCIVLSRLVFSTRLMEIVGHRRALVVLLMGTTAAVVLLIAAENAFVLCTAAGIAGFCIGPLYPLLLSFILEHTNRGWVFAASGLGSTIFPWLTGLLSARFGSLRLGMLAPCGGAVLMLLLLPLCLRLQMREPASSAHA